MNVQKEKVSKKYFTSLDLALLSIFIALWVALNLTLGPIGFQLFQLPIFCDVSVYLTLLLSVWAVGKFGTATLVGVVGSLITLLRGSPHILGFAISAIVFDILFLATRHNINKRFYNLGATILITLFSAYTAGVTIAILFMQRTLEFALIFWVVGMLLAEC